MLIDCTLVIWLDLLSYTTSKYFSFICQETFATWSLAKGLEHPPALVFEYYHGNIQTTAIDRRGGEGELRLS
jgi:hypothetical protein